MENKVNRELYELHTLPEIVTSFRIARLRWAGHVHRMNEEDVHKRIMKCTPEGKKGRGRPTLRWSNGILENVKVLGVKNWLTLAKDRVCLLYTSRCV